jgi:hypothetical protein
VSPVKYELGFYIPQDDILHCHRREIIESQHFIYINLAHSLIFMHSKQNVFHVFSAHFLVSDSVAFVRLRTIPTVRPPLVGEI